MVVRKENLLEVRMREDLSVWDISHKQLYNDLKLYNLGAECFGSDFRSLSKSLNQASLSLRVFKLNCLDSSKIVEIASILIV